MSASEKLRRKMGLALLCVTLILSIVCNVTLLRTLLSSRYCGFSLYQRQSEMVEHAAFLFGFLRNQVGVARESLQNGNELAFHDAVLQLNTASLIGSGSFFSSLRKQLPQEAGTLFTGLYYAITKGGYFWDHLAAEVKE